MTAVLAALAGAECRRRHPPTRYGTVAEVAAGPRELAEHLGSATESRVTAIATPKLFAAADVITNSGHVRPIVGPFADAIRPDAVLALMFEAWEIQAGRFDRGPGRLLVAEGCGSPGTNERHPDVDVFSFLGPMAVAQLADAGSRPTAARVAVLCDNPFSTFLRDGLSRQVRRCASAADSGSAPARPSPRRARR